MIGFVLLLLLVASNTYLQIKINLIQYDTLKLFELLSKDKLDKYCRDCEEFLSENQMKEPSLHPKKRSFFSQFTKHIEAPLTTNRNVDTSRNMLED